MRASLLLLALCAGCSAPQTECESLKDELSRCLGTRAARLDCSTVADADVRRLKSLTEGTSCEVIASALPIDGNFTSTTCRMFGVGCVAPNSPSPQHRPTRFPILLVNGIDTSPLFRYSDRITQMMTGPGGQTIWLATLTPWETPQHRAPELWALVQQVLQQTNQPKVNLVCHSLGGLDCRYLASPRGLQLDLGVRGVSEKIASITTVGTAHRGTRASDLLLGLVPDDGTRGQLVNDFATIAGDWFSPEALSNDVHLRDALRAISTDQAAAFNAEVNDAPGVFYQSFAGVSHPAGDANAAILQRETELCVPDEASDAVASSGARDDMALALVPLTDVVGKNGSAQLPNDGLVTVPSAKWGLFRGCLSADHMEQLGQRNIPDVNVTTGIDIARFYTAVASDLASRGM